MTITKSTNPQNLRTGNRGTVAYIERPVFYKDLNADYVPSQDNLIVFDNLAVRNKIMNLLGVLVGEEHFEPTWGSDLQLRLFELGGGPASDPTAFLIRGDTVDAVAKFMKSEVTLLHSQCSVTPLPARNGYDIILTYYANRTKAVDTLKFRLLLPRSR